MLYYKVLYNNNILYYTILCCECCQCIWCSFRLKLYCNCLHSFWSCRILFTFISSFLLPLYNCFIYSTECRIVCLITCLLFYVSICLWVCLFIYLSNCMQIHVYQPRLHFLSFSLLFSFHPLPFSYLSLGRYRRYRRTIERETGFEWYQEGRRLDSDGGEWRGNRSLLELRVFLPCRKSVYEKCLRIRS